MQTDGRIKADSRLAQIVCERAYLLIDYNDEVIGEKGRLIKQNICSLKMETSVFPDS